MSQQTGTSEEVGSIVIDHGSTMIKAGFAGDDRPRCAFPAIIGRPRHQNIMVGFGQKDVYVGDEAQAKKCILSLNYPIINGIITSFNDMEKIWHHLFYNELRQEPQNHSVLLTESYMANPKLNREKTVTIMMETFNVPSICIKNKSVLSLIACGKSTGIVLDSGYTMTQCVPIYEGHILKHGVSTMHLGGKHIDKYLIKLLTERGYTFSYDYLWDRQTVIDMKQTLAYIAKDYKFELNKDAKDIERSCEVPFFNERGKYRPWQCYVDVERFKCAEILFNTSIMIEKEWKFNGIQEMIYNSIIKCSDIDMRELCDNIVLSGGNTMFENIDIRLKKELNNFGLMKFKDDIVIDGFIKNNYSLQQFYKDIKHLIYKYSAPITKFTGNVIAPKERKYLSWIGGTIFASKKQCSDDSINFWITKDEYNEYGPNIVHRKCS
eukprot:298098_1